MIISKVVLLCLKFKYISYFFGRQNHESGFEADENDIMVLKRISWAIATVSYYIPWDSRCFAQALTAMAMLRLRKIKNTIYFGLRRDIDDRLLAHTWVRAGNVNVSGGSDCSEFTIVSYFGDV